MTHKPIALEAMTWQEFSAHRAESTIALAVGSVEQHGPHLPLSVDTLIPYNLALGLGRKRPVLVAPPLYYGYRSQPATGGGQAFPGTTSLSGATLTTITQDILQDFVRQGCKNFLLMNGHFENTSFLAEAAHLITAGNPGVKIVIANWWELVDPTLLDKLFPEGFPGWEVEHASLVETSLIMHFHPELVHADRIPSQKGEKFQSRPLVFPEPQGLVPASGILYSAQGASPDIGATIADELVKSLEEIWTQEFSNR